jgi:hypothetical protein
MPLHIIICGRAGYEYDFETNEETGKKELLKTGIKMKTEAEFGFEPSLLVEMERIQEQAGDGFVIRRRAKILGDRFDCIDGRVCDNPTFDFFKPHVERLRPGTHTPIDTSVSTQTGADLEGTDGWAQEKQRRKILCEEIQGEMVARWPGQTAAEKQAKSDLLNRLFGTRSWSKVEDLDASALAAGLASIKDGAAVGIG